MELEATWPRILRVWWALAWRNLIAIGVAMLIGALVGAVLGFIMGMLGVAPETIKASLMPVGLLIGLAISVIPVRMVLNRDFGDFRLALVRKS